jgi:uncharacterized protein YndB with AHSA1/START domain
MSSEQHQAVLAQPAVEIVRVVNFPRVRVWQAWIDPLKFARWWVSEGFEATDISADVRPGGGFRWGLRRELTGDTYMASGEYLEIVEPERFVLSWDSLHNDDYYVQGSRVTISFRDIEGKATEVRILHEFLNEARQCSDYSLGWSAAFDNLASFLAADGADAAGLLGEPQRSILLRTEIEAGATEIWPWLIDAGKLTQWFPSEVQIDARPGGSYTFRWLKQDGSCHERSGSITAVEPPLLLDMEWYPTNWDPKSGPEQDWREASRTMVSWRIRETEQGKCLVSLAHRGWGYGEIWDDMFKGHAGGWQLYITNLREIIEGRADIRT